MKSDAQLRQGMFGRLGSLWTRQVDRDTRDKARAVVSASGLSGVLRRLDVTAASSVSASRVLVDDTHFHFTDGNFAVLGRAQTDYDHSSFDSAYLPTLNDPPAANTAPVPGPLAALNAQFLLAIAGCESYLAAGTDWYLIPIPSGMSPIVIQGRDGDALVSGIDFETHVGFIALREPPALLLGVGLVRVMTAYVDVPAPNSFVLAAPTDRRCGKYLAEYARRSQSLVTFLRAAAEYCGMYVFSEPDLILSSHPVPDGVVYVTANLGGLRITYPHTPLTVGGVVDAGFVVALRLEVKQCTDGVVFFAAAPVGFNVQVSLDGVCPIKGLGFRPGIPVLVAKASYTEGRAHAQLHLDGGSPDLQRLWDLQKGHELATQTFLADELFLPGEDAKMIDFGALLESYYGPQLCMLTFAPMDSEMQQKLLRFVSEHKPSSCVMVTQQVEQGIAFIP